MAFNTINKNFGLTNGYDGQPQQVQQQPVGSQISTLYSDKKLVDPWVQKVGQLVSMLKSKSDFGQVSDILFRIPVLINGAIEIWEYDISKERDINAQNFQQHVVNISDSICKWNTASQIYNELVELKQMEYDTWKAKSMYIVRQQYANDKKMTESALKEVFMMQNEEIDTPKRLELLYLNGTKSVIDNAIIKSLNEKSKHLITIGLQYRNEMNGRMTIGY